jgi:hypothetical protein
LIPGKVHTFLLLTFHFEVKPVLLIRAVFFISSHSLICLLLPCFIRFHDHPTCNFYITKFIYESTHFGFENEDRMCLQNVGIRPQNCTVSRPPNKHNLIPEDCTIRGLDCVEIKNCFYQIVRKFSAIARGIL